MRTRFHGPALLLAACGASDPQGRTQAYDSVTGLASVDLLIDGAFRVGSISPAGRSGYQSVPPGTHRVALVESGTGREMVALDVSVADGASASVLAVGRLGGPPPPPPCGSRTTTPRRPPEGCGCAWRTGTRPSPT